ncbi:MAG: hypothetical protein ACKO2P_17485 [Planctomycetota bacterium]
MNGSIGKLAALIWLFAGWWLPADAQPIRIPGRRDFPGLDIQAAVGWEDVSDSGHPLAISLRLSNSSTRVLEGRVVLRNSETGETRSLGDVSVGPGGTRHFGTVAALSGWDSCELSWESSDAVLWARQLVVPAEPGVVAAVSLHAGLFVEDGRRRLNLPTLRPVLVTPAVLDRLNGTRTEPAADRDFVARGNSARELATIPPWQLPVHPGPLTAVHMVLLSPLLLPEQLSDVQYRALARWVALGGIVIMAEESQGILERLREQLPLQPRPSLMLDGLMTYPCGMGSIRQFAAAEFAREGSTTMSAIGELAASAVSSPLFTRLAQHRGVQETPRMTDSGNVAVLALFGLYAVAAALPIVMFRSTRQRQMSWVVGVVLTACVGAGVLGVAIRRRPGDVALKTVTWIGEDCLVQAAGMNLKSAGRGELNIEIRGEEPDLQVSRPGMENDLEFSGMSGNWQTSGWLEGAADPAWPPFNLAPSTSADPAWNRISVPVSPWSRRQVTGVDLRPLEGRLEVVLEAIPSGAPVSEDRWNQVGSFPDGRPLRVRLKSSLPFRLSECRLGMIVWKRPAASEAEWMLYHSLVDLPEVAVASEAQVTAFEHDFNTSFEWVADHSGLNRRYLEMSSMVPHGEMEVWVEGRLEASPLMQLKGDDFRETVPAEHAFYYRVPRENLPEVWRDLQEWKGAAEIR